jgi:hypothetical protein
MTSRWQRLGLLAVTLMATGCGPTIPLDADIKAVGYDVFFGPPDALAPPAPSVSAPAPVVIPVFVVPPGAPPGAPPQISFLPQPAGPACPTAPPLSYPSLQAPLTGPTKPPLAAPYTYRVVGSTTSHPGAADQKVSYYPAAESREVTSVSGPDSSGTYSFRVIRTVGDASSNTQYTVIPNGTANVDAGAAGKPGAGLYLSQFSNSQGVTFNPSAAVEIMAFPAIPSNPYQGAGSDPVNRTSMAMNPPAIVAPGLPVGLPTSPPSPPGVVQSGFIARGSHLVDACGVVVDSVENEIFGKFTDAAHNMVTDFDYTFDVATQFGGIVVADHLLESVTDSSGSVAFKRDVKSTINQVPKG